MALKMRHRVVALDQRGYGESGMPGSGWGDSGNYSVKHLSDDILHFVEAMGNEKVIVAAHDWGAVVGWAVAGQLDRCGKLDGLIILNGPHLGSYFKNAGLAQYLKSLYIAIFSAPWLPELWLTRNNGYFLDACFLGKGMGVARKGERLAVTKEDVAVFKWGVGRPGRLSAALNWYRALSGTSVGDFFRTAPAPGNPLQAPCLVIWGENDGALGSELLKDTRSYTTSLSIKYVQTCSHWAQQDAVEEVLKIAANFLNTELVGEDLEKIKKSL